MTKNNTEHPTASNFRFSHFLRVRWSEVDMQKIVFNPHYLMYFDTAIAEYWRAMAMPYEETLQHLGGDINIVKASVEYRASAHFDDVLQVALRCARLGRSSITFEGAIFTNGRLLTQSELIYVFIDPNQQKALTVPDKLRNWLSDFEAGQPMYSVQMGRWTELGPKALALRTEVFVIEQGIPLALEQDELDDDATHCVLVNSVQQAIATARIVRQSNQVARIGRVAVKRVLRGSKLGSVVLQTLLNYARAQGYREVILHAQIATQAFYTRHGFQASGAEFEEDGIAHIEMKKNIT